MYPRLAPPVFALLILTLAACGSNGAADPDCTDDADCDGAEVCLDQACIGEPAPGADCPDDRDGAEADGLVCDDGTWTVVPDELIYSAVPPAEITAGDSFEITLEIVDDRGRTALVDDLEVTAELNRGEFSSGEPTASATTEQGVADFELAVDTPDTGLVLFATAEVDDTQLETNSSAFDVLVGPADPGQSAITGQTGVPADGETAAEITVELADALGNPVAGVVPHVTATGQGNEYQPCSETDENGVAECAMTSTHAGDKTLEITAPVELTGETIEFDLVCYEAQFFGGGDGSSDNPYRLCEPEHLETLGAAAVVLTAHFVLVEDVDMAEADEFTPVGDTDFPFDGTFDGNDHRIENLTFNQAPAADTVGLFGVVGDEGLVENLTVQDVDIDVDGARYTGGVVAENYGEFHDVRATGTVRANDDTVGGFVGNMGGGLITDSSADCEVAADSEAGGFVGEIADGRIARSFATGDVSADEQAAGGFLGVSWLGGIVEDSFATGDVSTAYDEVGGFAGTPGPATIEHSYSTGVVSGTQPGGFAGSDIDAQANYWDTTTSQTTFGIGGGATDTEVTGLETDDFDDDTNFDDWDFDTVWTIDDAPDGEDRPVLQ